jgi:DNA invertase Pin-like site-specific DNA recombinase
MVTHSEKTTALRIGYARVSTYEQSLDSQIDSLKQAGCQRIYCDRISGSKADRHELNRLKESLRSGDTLVVWRLDRLGRSLRDLIGWVEWLDQTGVTLHSLNEQIDTAHHTGKLVFHLFAALAEFERDLIRERTLAGLAAARARGRQGGRKAKLNASDIRQLKAMHKDHSISIGEICKRLSISKTTLYRYLRKP